MINTVAILAQEAPFIMDTLPSALIKFIIDTESVVMGGLVRDDIMGIPFNDVDIYTPLQNGKHPEDYMGELYILLERSDITFMFAPINMKYRHTNVYLETRVGSISTHDDHCYYIDVNFITMNYYGRDSHPVYSLNVDTLQNGLFYYYDLESQKFKLGHYKASNGALSQTEINYLYSSTSGMNLDKHASFIDMIALTLKKKNPEMYITHDACGETTPNIMVYNTMNKFSYYVSDIHLEYRRRKKAENRFRKFTKKGFNHYNFDKCECGRDCLYRTLTNGRDSRWIMYIRDKYLKA